MAAVTRVMVRVEVETMIEFKYSEGAIEIEDGDIWIRDAEGDYVKIQHGVFHEFFAAIDAARDEVMPPGPIEIPDHARYDEVRKRIAVVRDQPFDPNEVKGALGRFNLQIGNLLNPGRDVARSS